MLPVSFPIQFFFYWFPVCCFCIVLPSRLSSVVNLWFLRLLWFFLVMGDWQLGVVNMNCELVDPEGLVNHLRILKSINVDGVMVDCWWGIVESHSPQVYNWSGYRRLFQIVRDLKLKLQVSNLCKMLIWVFSMYCHWLFSALTVRLCTFL